MRKVISIVILFLLSLSAILIIHKEAYAVDQSDYPTSLNAEPVCTGPENDKPAIAFEWDSSQDYENFNWRLSYTGLGSEFIDVNASRALMPIVKEVNPNTEINWSVEVCDKQFSSHQCEKKNGPSVTSGNCTTNNPVPASPQSCPKCPSGFTWSSTHNLCKNGDSLRNPESRNDCSSDGTQCRAGEGTCFTPDSEIPHNCANRSAACSKDRFPLCVQYEWNERWECDNNPNYGCTMQEKNKSRSCAYKERPTCSAEGETCTGEAGSTGPDSGCCTSFLCDKAGRDDREGTCKAIPDSEHPCIKCPTDSKWNASQSRCEDSSGKPVEGSGLMCGENARCVAGDGCVKTCNSDADCTEGKNKFCVPDSKGVRVCTDNERGYAALACSRDSAGTLDFECKTAIGTITASPEAFVKTALAFFLGIAGGILLILLIFNGYKLMVSQGDPEKIKDAREGIIAAISGLFLIIFSLSILALITSTILNIPGF